MRHDLNFDTISTLMRHYFNETQVEMPGRKSCLDAGITTYQEFYPDYSFELFTQIFLIIMISEQNFTSNFFNRKTVTVKAM